MNENAMFDPFDRDLLIRTVIGEARNQPSLGQAAVAHVVLNRLNAGGYGDGVRGVVFKKHQFEPWNNPQTRSKLLAYTGEEPDYQRAAAIVDDVIGGRIADPTRGATHFANVDTVRQRGDAAGKPGGWLSKMSNVSRIGAHTFGNADAGRGGLPNDLELIDEPVTGKAPPIGKVETRPLGPPVPDDLELLEDAPTAVADAPGPGAQPVEFAIPEESEAAKAARQQAADEKLIGKPSLKNTVMTGLVSYGDTVGLNAVTAGAAYLRSLVKGEPYAQAHDHAKNVREALERQNPGASWAGFGGGVVAGAVAVPALKFGAPVVNAAGQVIDKGSRAVRALTAGGTAAAGAATGEAIDSRGDVGRTVTAGVIGGVAGTALAPVAEKVAGGLTALWTKARGNPAALVDGNGRLTAEAEEVVRAAGLVDDQGNTFDLGPDVLAAIRQTADTKGLTPDAVREALGKRFGVDLSLGQASDDFTQRQFEETARKGGFGEDAQRPMGEFFDTQAEQLAAAKRKVGEDLGGLRVDTSPEAAGLPLDQRIKPGAVDSPQEAGAVVAEGLRSKAAVDKAGYKAKYDTALSKEGEFAPTAFDDLGANVRQNLEARAEPVLIDPQLTPAANQALDTLSKMKGVTAEGGGLDMRRVEQTRKKLVASYKAAKSSGKAEDMRAVSAVMHEFDDHLERVMADGLFSGDEAALPALKEARKAFAAYQRTYRPQGAGDDAGNALRKIIERDATPGEVANYLFGSAKVGERGVSVRLAKRLQGVLGQDSAEWAAIRQGLWQRLTSKPEGVDDFGPQALGNRINQFLNGDGRELASILFTREERMLMGEFAALQKVLAPKAGTVNHSNSATTLGAMVAKISKRAPQLMTIMGFVDGGIVSGAAGYGLAKALEASGKAISSSKTARRVEAAAQGAAKAPRPPTLAPIGLPVGMAVGQDD